MKIVLGTAQFGADYGISNLGGKIKKADVFSILDEALISGIDTLDTARVYGDSEEVIGEFSRLKKADFNVVSKLPACLAVEAESLFQDSLRRLNAPKLYGYLIHDFASFSKDPAFWDWILTAKKRGLLDKAGFSLYYPEELDLVLKRGIVPDMVQLPLNIFDQRFMGYLPALKRMKIEVYVRSVFLQGLVFLDPEMLQGYFANMRSGLRKLRQIAADQGCSVASVCMKFVLANINVDKVVVGVDSLANLKELVIAQGDASPEIAYMADLLSLRVNDEKMILPVHWPPRN